MQDNLEHGEERCAKYKYKNHDGQRRDNFLCILLRPEIGEIFSTFWGHFLTKQHRNPGRTAEKSHGEYSKHPVDKSLRVRRFCVACRGRACPDMSETASFFICPSEGSVRVERSKAKLKPKGCSGLTPGHPDLKASHPKASHVPNPPPR